MEYQITKKGAQVMWNNSINDKEARIDLKMVGFDNFDDYWEHYDSSKFQGGETIKIDKETAKKHYTIKEAIIWTIKVVCIYCIFTIVVLLLLSLLK